MEKRDITYYSCDKDLSIYTNSMLFDSELTIASMDFDDGNFSGRIDYITRGYVKVWYKDELYTAPSMFTEEMRELIKNNTYMDCGEDFIIDENNWFEMIYEIKDCSGRVVINDGEVDDGPAFDTPETLQQIMLNTVNKAIVRFKTSKQKIGIS